jgi:ANTAR domain-containing protein
MTALDSADGAGFGRVDQDRISAEVREIVDRRAVIEQAKGMLMFIYGIDADTAFGILRWQSQQHNVKLRLVAERIARGILELSEPLPPARRAAFDNVLLTANQRADA